MKAAEKKWVAILGVALAAALAIFAWQVREFRAHAASASLRPMSCLEFCHVGCEKNRVCGGFKGDCASACTERCANAPAPVFFDAPRCYDRVHSLSCAEADRLGEGDASVLGPDCVRPR